jgi:hypothetical protein
MNTLPELSSSLTGSVTSGVEFTYTPTSVTGGTTFAWSRAVVAGISNSAANGTGSVTEILTNTTLDPVDVTYVYTLTAPSGCVNTQNVVYTVNPPLEARITTQAGTTEDVMIELTAMPNPTDSYFNLSVKSNHTGPVSIRVFDLFRKTIEVHPKVMPGTVIRMGDKWTGGSYFVEVIQGKNRKVLKVIKAN